MIYWAFQLMMCLGLYAMYTEKAGVVENLLFVASFRAQYFHMLLPLYEPWALARNIALCLSFGTFAAVGSLNARNGRSAPLGLFLVTLMVWFLLFPSGIATSEADVALIVLSLGCLAADIYLTWRWTVDEAD